MDRVMTEHMGGEVAEFIKKWKGKIIRCFGVCRMEQQMSTFKGYLHSGGLKDDKGRAWWVHYTCPDCQYGHSFSKMDFFAKHTEIEREAENERVN